MPNPKDTVILIDDYVSSADKLEPLQKALFNKVSKELKELTLDSEGYIERTSSNLDIINNVKAELNAVLSDPKYKAIVDNVSGALDDVNELQNNYFKQLGGASIPPVVNTMTNQAFDMAKDDLTKAGFQENVVNVASNIVQTSITEGTSYADMNSQLSDFILGTDKVDGKLVGYTKQILGDTLHSASRNYNSIMTDKLGLKWYRYVGAEVKATRPWCHALVDKEWLHESELGAICRGLIDGKKVSLTGLMPDTTKENVVSRCGGYNCGHHLVPVPAESVPTNIRRKFEQDIKTPIEELRPKR